MCLFAGTYEFENSKAETIELYIPVFLHQKSGHVSKALYTTLNPGIKYSSNPTLTMLYFVISSLTIKNCFLSCYFLSKIMTTRYRRNNDYCYFYAMNFKFVYVWLFQRSGKFLLKIWWQPIWCTFIYNYSLVYRLLYGLHVYFIAQNNTVTYFQDCFFAGSIL